MYRIVNIESLILSVKHQCNNANLLLSKEKRGKDINIYNNNYILMLSMLITNQAQ